MRDRSSVSHMWMNFASGKISLRNAILDQPEYSAMNLGLRWYAKDLGDRLPEEPLRVRRHVVSDQITEGFREPREASGPQRIRLRVLRDAPRELHT